MPLAHRTSAVSLGLSIGVVIIAAALTARQWRDRRRREPDLSREDASYFRRQDVRRVFGAVVMVLLAAGIAAGSRIAPKVANRLNPAFPRLWLGVFVLVLVLLVLALLDWVSTRLYARRQRRALAREHVERLRDELRRRSYPPNGKAGSRDGAAP